MILIDIVVWIFVIHLSTWPVPRQSEGDADFSVAPAQPRLQRMSLFYHRLTINIHTWDCKDWLIPQRVAYLVSEQVVVVVAAALVLYC